MITCAKGILLEGIMINERGEFMFYINKAYLLNVSLHIIYGPFTGFHFNYFLRELCQRDVFSCRSGSLTILLTQQKQIYVSNLKENENM